MVVLEHNRHRTCIQSTPSDARSVNRSILLAKDECCKSVSLFILSISVGNIRFSTTHETELEQQPSLLRRGT